MKKALLLILFLLPFALFAQGYALGDTNHNGTIDVIDALLVAQYSVGLNPPGFYAAEADTNCSNSITIVDALLIAQRYVGLISQFPCQTPTPTPYATPTPTSPVSTAVSGLPVPPTSGVAKPSGSAGNLSVLNWAGFKGAVTYTFDDANSSQINNYSTLNNLGVRMTFYIQTNKSEASNSIWAQAVSNGHELGNHTQSHSSNGTGSDVDACTTFLKQKFGVTAYTMAAPYGSTSYVSLASTRFLLNRGVNGGSIAPNGSSDPFNLPCHIPATGAQASAFNSVISSARNAGNWQIVLVHGFSGGTDGAYQPVDISQFTSSVNYAKSFGDMWIDSAVNVGAYWRAQKVFSSLSPGSSGGTLTYQWTLPSNFPPGKFLRVKVSGGTLKQNGATLAWSDHGYYEVALDVKSLTISP